MTITEIFADARAKLNDQYVPYKWADSELIDYLNEAEREACRRANLIVDKSTAAYCRIELVAGTAVYSLDTKVLKVRNAYIGPSVSGTTFSWDSTTKTLADSGSGFLTAGFEEGMKITVGGFTTAANNGQFTIDSVVAGSIVVDEDTMTTEIAGDSVTIHSDLTPLMETTRAVMDLDSGAWQTTTGEPTCFIKESGTELLVYPIPTEANTLSLIVSRLPASAMTTTTMTASPEIPEQYHYDLSVWMCKLAYERAGSDTNDLNKATYYDKLFTDRFGDRPSARAEAFRRRNPRMGQVRWRSFGV